MALAISALLDASNAVNAAITHLGLHSAAPGASGTTAAVGTRVANTGTVNSSTAAITRASAAFTGLAANQSVTHVSYWTASTGGTFKGASALTGDTTANAAGEFTVSSITESVTSS